MSTSPAVAAHAVFGETDGGAGLGARAAGHLDSRRERLVPGGYRVLTGGGDANGLARLVLRHYRWLMLTLPVYTLIAMGASGWPIAAGLASAAILYNTILSVAERRWPDWVARRTIYLRCIEIGLICVGLSVLYLQGHNLDSNRFYYDGFYAVFVALAGVSAGRKGVFWGTGVAVLAVAIGQVIGAPPVSAIFSLAGLEYWSEVGLYSSLFGLFFVAIGLLADFATEFESQLQSARQVSQMHNQFASLRDAVLVVRHDGRISGANRAAEKLFGTTADALRSRDVRDLLGPESEETLDEPLLSPGASQSPLPVRARRTSGDDFPAEATFSHYDLPASEHPLVVVVVRDLSERQRIVEIATHRERLATVGELTARVIHQLSNPLTGIASIADSMLAAGAAANEQEALLVIRDEAERASGLVRNMLQFARRQAGSSSRILLNQIVRRALDLYALRSGRSENVEIVVDLCPETAWVSGSATHIEQAVFNLLDNARDAVIEKGSGRIVIRTRTDDGRVRLEVEDTGPGIRDEVRARIFEPFFTTKAPGVGTGLGLAIVEQLVRDCGGAISLDSEVGVGTTVRVSLLQLDPDLAGEEMLVF